MERYITDERTGLKYEQAEDMFSRLVKELAEKDGITERLKAENQMLWVQRMNNIRERAEEIVRATLLQ